ncbi:hypothetical protein B0T24DRAFT_673010 [Lasiosphaeria ovina]|uniref:dihydroneopterin aldolase n=1 Tax=Lasiosphaeria ovina TaxID=92902 RepID=A0AAE0TXI0_9PEZI|nr:hypothetical protein B0T24DRAFT_673010 [Lasiosphaeria ovina]
MADNEQRQQHTSPAPPAPPPLKSLWSVRSAAGEPFAAVRVRNLQAVVQAGVDAWGRANRAQPVLVSAEIYFHAPFDTAASDDRLGADTVHYGLLSKAVAVSLLPASIAAAAAVNKTATDAATLRDVLDCVWSHLTGRRLDGVASLSPSFLALARVRYLAVTVTLPKASLLGDSVSLTAAAVFAQPSAPAPAPIGDQTQSQQQPQTQPDQLAIALELHNLRVPTLVGVNDNERLAKQVVVASLTVDKFDQKLDTYTSIETLVVKALEESSFETLEALGAHLTDLVLATYHCGTHAGPLTGGRDWQAHVRLEKPTAVMFADCPIVEVRAGSDFIRLPEATATTTVSATADIPAAAAASVLTSRSPPPYPLA